MAVPLLCGPANLEVNELGIGPGGDTGSPKYTFTMFVPSASNIVSALATIRANGMRVALNLAGSRTTWTRLVNGVRVYDPVLYQRNVSRWLPASTRAADGGEVSDEVANAIADAFEDFTAFGFLADEPAHSEFGGTITSEHVNSMGTLFKDYWPGTLTAVRADHLKLAELGATPVGGWSGVDYGWAQYEGHGVGSSRITFSEYYDGRKAGLLALDMGMIPALNFIDGGIKLTTLDGVSACWDALATGTSDGVLKGSYTGSAAQGTFYQCGTAPSTENRFFPNPEWLKRWADVVATDLDAPFATGFSAYSTPIMRDNWLSIWNRADMTAAWNYVMTTLAARASFNGLRTPKGFVEPPAEVGIQLIGSAAAAATTVAVPTHAVGDLLMFTATNDASTTIPSLPAGKTSVSTASGSGGIRFIGSAAAAGTGVTPPAHAVGDLLVFTATNTASTTVPTLPSGKTAINTASGNTVAIRKCYVIATSTSTPGTGFTNATAVTCDVYRGTHPTTPIGGVSSGAFNNTTIAYDDVTFTATDNSSWCHAAAVHATATNIRTTLPTGMVNRGGILQSGTFDTNSGETGWTEVDVTVNASGGSRALMCELLADPASTVGVGIRVGYRIATSTSETSGTWTNATAVAVTVYRGAHPSSPIGTTGTDGFVSQPTLFYPTITPGIVDGTSWAMSAAVHSAATDVGTNAPTGMSARASIGKMGTFDTNGGVTGNVFSQSVSVNATGGSRTILVELVADPAGTPPPVNAPPVLTTILDQRVEELATLTFTASATDPEGHDVEYSLLAGLTSVPTGMTINATTGEFSWTPTHDQIGTYDIIVRATDIEGTNPQSPHDQQTVVIEVTEIPGTEEPNPNGEFETAIAIAERAQADYTAASELVELLLDQQQMNAAVIERAQALLADITTSKTYMDDVIADLEAAP